MIESNETESKRKTIYRPTAVEGVRSVWDWSEKKQDYVQRSSGNRYIATVKRNQRTKSESCGSIEDARKWRERVKYDMERIPDVKPMTFKDLLNEFFRKKDGKLQITTIENYRGHLRHFEVLNDSLVEDITSQVIDRWLAEVTSMPYRLRMKLKANRLSFCHEVVFLRNVFSHYREYFNEKFENPVRQRHDLDAIINQKEIDRRKRAEKHKFISGEEIERVLSVFQAQVEEKPDREMYRVMALIQLRSGLRVGETAALSYKDIDWNTGIVHINKTVQWMRYKTRPSVISDNTKTKSDRIVIFIPEVLEALKKLKRSQGRIGGLIFSEDGERIVTYRCIQHHYACAFATAKVDIRSTHILRHSFATHFLESTSDANATKALLGHSSFKMTEKYAKPTHKTAIAGMLAYQNSLQQAAKPNGG